jgi:PEGA domain-containing protein
MRRVQTAILKALVVAGFVASGASLAIAGGPRGSFGAAPSAGFRGGSAGAMRSYSYPSYGSYGYSTPFLSAPSLSQPYAYMPKYWWTGSYSTEDPRQAGYNPSAGYRWQDVTTLIVTTSPAKAQVTLDGNDIGSADDLGPIQLPLGEHTLRVEAPGFEPSETVMKVQTPSVQKLQINLKAARPAVASNSHH